jgi:hypothetical protein
MLSERSDTQRLDSAFIWHSGKAKTIGTQNTKECPGSESERKC